MLIDRLIDKIIQLQSPITVGLDPRLPQIPSRMKEDIYFSRGKTPEAAAKIAYRFNRSIIDQIYDIVPAITLPMATYEQWGVPGINCYIKTAEYARSKSLLIIGDVKRNDTGTAAEAYSHGHIGKVDVEGKSHKIFDEDFVSINPYMGYDSIEPYLADCKSYGKGIFALVKALDRASSKTASKAGSDTASKTASNSSSKGSASSIQNLITSEGLPVYQHVAELVSKWGQGLIGKHGFSSVGAIISPSNIEEGRTLRDDMPHTFFLIPEPAPIKTLQAMLNKSNIGIIVNGSREITEAYLSDAYKSYGETGFAQAARAAALDMKKDLLYFA